MTAITFLERIMWELSLFRNERLTLAQQLMGKFKGELFYWTSPGKAEVVFLFPDEGIIYPLEAKSGINLKSKSLKVYSEKYKPAIISRTSLNNMNADGITRNYPLYALSLFPPGMLPDPL